MQNREVCNLESVILNNGLEMPIVGFGTWDVRGKDGKRSILDALEVGYRLIDTAQMYENESVVGAAVKESGLQRRDVFITTKLYRDCTTYETAKQGIQKSLYELQTDYIDLLLIHEPYDTAEEMYEAFKEAYADGTVKAIGISNFGKEKYNDFVNTCEIVPAVNQVESHVYFSQLDLRDVMLERGTKMQSWASFTEGRRDIFSEPILVSIAKKYGKTSGQIALKFLVQNGVGVIPKSLHKERMIENLDIFDFELSDEEIRQIKSMDEGVSLFGWY